MGYYSYGLPTFIVIVIALYLLFTGTFRHVALKPSMVRTDTTNFGRCRRDLQRWSFLGRVESVCLGWYGYWVVHWVLIFEAVRGILVVNAIAFNVATTQQDIDVVGLQLSNSVRTLAEMQ